MEEPRGAVTQTRTFVWQGSDMVSATNPENGTVNYTYDGAHRVLTRTDAKNQQTQYTYDTYGRKTGVLQAGQSVGYYFDSSSALAVNFSQNALGRLAAVTFTSESGGSPNRFAYLYSYKPSGHLARQRMRVFVGPTDNDYRDMEALYEWDNEGKMVGMAPPGTQQSIGYTDGPSGGIKYLYYYDVQGRLSSMMETGCLTQTVTNNPCAPGNGTTLATATYGIAGEITGLTYDGYTESRTYNSLLQMTNMTATRNGQTEMNMQYTFSGTQNNGRITESRDGVSGETVTYGYDTLNRLINAAGSGWTEAYAYDGFGNLTGKTPTGNAPSMSATYNGTTNRQSGLAYDDNGNTGGTFDVENRMVQATGSATLWTYDPSGKRVFAKTPGNGTTVATTCEIYFYDITGKKLVNYQCGYHDQTGGDGAFWFTVASRNLYFGGKMIAAAGTTVVTDRLGSVRANSNGYGQWAGEVWYVCAGCEWGGLCGPAVLCEREWEIFVAGPGRSRLRLLAEYDNMEPILVRDCRSCYFNDATGQNQAPVGGPIQVPDWYCEMVGLPPGCGGEYPGGGGGGGGGGGSCIGASGFLPSTCNTPNDPDPPEPPEPKRPYRTYFLIVTNDCYSVFSNGTAERHISYNLAFLEQGMPGPMTIGQGTIWEHLTGDLPPAGANSPSSAAPGTYPDVLAIYSSTIAQQSLTQTFSVMLNGVDIGLAIAAFGGTVANPSAGNNIEKYPGYSSINGNIGGEVRNGKLVRGTYRPCD